jgi:hypothetical protein
MSAADYEIHSHDPFPDVDTKNLPRSTQRELIDLNQNAFFSSL